MTPEEKIKLEKMFEWFQQMQSADSIPLSTHQALSERFSSFSSVLINSSKSAISETVAVIDTDGGVINTYAVLGQPDAFLQVTVGSNVYYVPAFT